MVMKNFKDYIIYILKILKPCGHVEKTLDFFVSRYTKCNM